MARSSLHIQVTAHDRPGILAETLAFIVEVGWNVVDIKQFVFNGMLNLSILLDEDDESLVSPLKEVLTKYAEQRNFKIAIYPSTTNNLHISATTHKQRRNKKQTNKQQTNKQTNKQRDKQINKDVIKGWQEFVITEETEKKKQERKVEREREAKGGSTAYL